MTVSGAQRTRSEWHEQWSMFEDNERFLFEEWIAPVTLAEVRGRRVLEAGCGGGQHTAVIAEVAAKVIAVDLNTAEIAKKRNQDTDNVEVVEADIATMDLGAQFDVVMCIGVIHHTDNPDQTFENLYRHLRPGGLMVIWTYSAEGNAMVRYGVEPLRKLLLRRLSRRRLARLATGITAAMVPVVYSVYRAPFLGFLPYYDYFSNFRRLSFHRNVLNVFDKLNAPQTRFTTAVTCRRWFSPDRFEPTSISIRRYAGVSYSLAGIKQ